MPYSNYQDDPVSQRVNNSFANLCATDPKKMVLKLIDRCFSIFNRGASVAKFCDLENLLYPVDSYQTVDFEVCAGETLVIYDNQLDNIPITPVGNTLTNYPLGAGTEYFDLPPAPNDHYLILPNDRNYARGCILNPMYPNADRNGEDILPANKSCDLIITDLSLTSTAIPLSQAFTYFANPETRNAKKLINKIEIHNPNSNFSVKVKAMIVYVKSNADSSDCAC